MSYNQAPLLAYWWLDGYVDFSAEQAPRVRQALEEYVAWHRSTQLPDYAQLLQRLQPLAQDKVTAQQVCAVADDLQRRLEVAYEQAVPAMAEIVRSFGPAQIDHLAKRYARNNEETQRDFLQADLAERREATLKRTVERAETIYGALDEGQRALLAAGLEVSPFDPQRWLAERRARQQDILRTLRQLLAEHADAGTAQAALRAFAAQAARSPRAEYRHYQLRLIEANCALTAQLHNSTRSAQRQHAVDKLKGWAEDAKALMRP
ncbi:DUF6279 family lipoprotein [Aquabacterium sp.]|uniref:DUF6279 family lipoprotein n=1 Tax=Aquabacterium sp. TaxID=1872578 RepID=UPI002B63098E|nr:DUF6279 family lipoprotein [Aquabacterium sp.]HSW04990.1 DUF6279 family lipoprotein [Aquabacterium sp.]